MFMSERVQNVERASRASTLAALFPVETNRFQVSSQRRLRSYPVCNLRRKESETAHMKLPPRSNFDGCHPETLGL